MIIYLGIKRPHIHRGKNKLYLANEFLLIISMYILVCFTDFVPISETRYNIGYGQIVTLGIAGAINLIYTLVESLCQQLRRLKLSILKFKYQQRMKKLESKKVLNISKEPVNASVNDNKTPIT